MGGSNLSYSFKVAKILKFIFRLIALMIAMENEALYDYWILPLVSSGNKRITWM